MTVSKQVWRRRAPRLPVDRPGRLSGRLPQQIGVLELSLTGCLVRCGALLERGAILDLEIALEDGPLTAKVRVADASVDGAAAGGDRPGCLAGLEFLGLPAREAARLRRFLDEERRRRSAHASPR
jgi:PilZ domain-containing protein